MAVSRTSLSNSCGCGVLTFDHPFHLHPSSVHGALNPAVLPCEELDEFDSADQLVKDCHAFVSRGRDALLNANAALSDVAVERPASKEHDKAGECRETQKTVDMK